MLRIESKDLVEDFVEYLRSNHPEYDRLTKLQLGQACRFFFSFLKASMKREDLPPIRVRHFGLFQVKPGKALAALRAHEKGLRSPNVQMPELIQGRIDMLTNFLNIHAPHKLLPKQGKAQPEEYMGLPPGQSEIPSVLLRENPAEIPPEKPHKGTDQFPDFLHGLSLL